MTIRILSDKSEVVIPGIDLKPDRFAFGIPYIPQSHKPNNLLCEISNYLEAIQILEKLDDSTNSEGTTNDNDDVLYELEKIISGNEPKKFEDNSEEEVKQDEEDDELDDQIVQQTLF